jgi:hypothetical protein
MVDLLSRGGALRLWARQEFEGPETRPGPGGTSPAEAGPGLRTKLEAAPRYAGMVESCKLKL